MVEDISALSPVVPGGCGGGGGRMINEGSSMLLATKLPFYTVSYSCWGCPATGSVERGLHSQASLYQSRCSVRASSMFVLEDNFLTVAQASLQAF